MYKTIVVTLVFLTMSFSVNANTERQIVVDASAISSLRAHSSKHHVSNARSMQMMWIGGLSDGCTSVYLYANDDPALYSTVLAAFTTRSKIRLYYAIDASNRGPWGDTSSCLLTSITLEK